MIIVVLGAPGSGKGTVAEMLAQEYKCRHISPGDLFRREISNQTELGKQIKDAMEKGELVDDRTVIEVVMQELKNSGGKAVIDGCPRTPEQAKMLDEAVQKEGREIDFVFELLADEQEIINRLTNRRVCSKCGAIYNIVTHPPRQEGVCDVCGGELIQRGDDTEEVIKKRIADYVTNIKAIENYYDSKEDGGVIHVDTGGRPSDVVFQEIKQIIDEWAGFIRDQDAEADEMNQRFEDVREIAKRAGETLLQEAAPRETTLPVLQELLRRGYDTVEFVANPDCCRKCRMMNRRKWKLNDFIRRAKYRAPIYTVSHPGCKCAIKISSTKDKGLENVVIDYTGMEVEV